MSQTYRIGSLNFTGSQAVVSGSINVSGSLNVNNQFSVGMYDSSSGYLLFPIYNTNNGANFPSNPITGSIFLDMGPFPGSSTPALWIYIGGVTPWRWLLFEVPA